MLQVSKSTGMARTCLISNYMESLMLNVIAVFSRSRVVVDLTLHFFPMGVLKCYNGADFCSFSN